MTELTQIEEWIIANQHLPLKDMAAKWGISVPTISTYGKSARKKMGMPLKKQRHSCFDEVLIPEQKVYKMQRPKGFYSNRSPYGIASAFLQNAL